MAGFSILNAENEIAEKTFVGFVFDSVFNQAFLIYGDIILRNINGAQIARIAVC